MKKKNALTGAAIAAAVATMFIANGAHATDDSANSSVQVKCVGANACKGQSLCQSAASDCKGSNACKGKGWVFTTDEKTCADAGGKPEPQAKAD